MLENRHIKYFHKMPFVIIYTFFISLIIIPFVTEKVSASTFEEDIANAAKKGTIQLNEIKALGGFLDKIGGSKIKVLEVRNVKSTGGALTGDITMLNSEWSILIYSGGTLNTTLIAFGPKKIFKFKHMFKSVPGIEIIDLMVPTHQALALTPMAFSLTNSDMPKGVISFFKPFYDNKTDFDLKLGEGLSSISIIDMGKSGLIDDAFKFLGGKSTEFQLRANIAGNVIDAMLSGKPPVPSISFTGTLPTFRPKIGGLLQLPADVQFSAMGMLSETKASFGYSGTTQFKVAGKKVDMTLASSVVQPLGGPMKVVVSASTMEGEPLKNAFGLKWLTIEDYKMSFSANEAGILTIGFDGTTGLGSKNVRIGGSAQLVSGEVPLPESLMLEIDDGPDVVGSLSLDDLVSAFNAMSKAAGAKKLIPLDMIPDLEITGISKGKGPEVILYLSLDANAGFDIAGNLRILGQDIATVEEASAKIGSGIAIKASTSKLKAGPIQFPTSNIAILAGSDPATGKFNLPQITFSGEGLELFGSKNTFEMLLTPVYSSIKFDEDLGSLLKMDFMADAGVKGLNTFKDLEKADLRLKMSLSSDPAEFIRTSGKKAVTAALKEVSKGVDGLLQDVKDAQKKVDDLSAEIDKQRAIVKKETQGAADQIKKAESHVNEINTKITAPNNKISNLNGQIKS